jgi:hypothetical protein
MTGQYYDKATVAPLHILFNSLVTHHFTTRHYTISITGSCILLIPYNMTYCRLPAAWCPWNCIAWFEKLAGRAHEHGQRACSDSRYLVSDEILSRLWRGNEKNYIRLNFVIFTFHLTYSNHSRNKKCIKNGNKTKTEMLWNLKRQRSTNFPKPMGYFKSVGSRRMPQSKFRSRHPQILGATAQNFVGTWQTPQIGRTN